jgi:hypothetical protein
MIKILIGGSPIELLPDTSITLHFQSPIFFEEGTYSLPIRIANSINNKRIFNFPARIGNLSNKKLSYNCELVANSFRLKGLLVINSVSQNIIDAYYTDGIGQFNYLTEGKYLTDIEDPESVTLDSPNTYFDYLFDTINYQYPERKFVAFPSINLALFDKTSSETLYRNREGWINKWDWENEEFSFFVNEYNMPHFFLSYVLEKIFATYGFNLNENLFYNNEELRQLVVMSDFFKKLKGLLYDPTNPDYKFKPSYYLPKYLLKSFISDLRSMFFCEFFINNRSQTVDVKLLRDILISPAYIDITDKADKNYTIEPDEIEDGYKFGFELDQDDELMTEILDIEKLNRADDVGTRDDLPDYGEQMQEHENEIRLVRDENAFYFLFYDYDNPDYVWQWGFFTDNLANTVSGDGQLSRISSITPPRMKVKSGMYMPHVQCQAFDIDDHPYKDQGGVYTQFKEKDIAQNKPRLVFWRGLRTYSMHSYPYATHDIYYREMNGVLSKIPGKTIALLMTGEGNLVDNFGKEFIHWWFNVKKYTTWRINWETIDLHSLDFSAKYRIGNQNYLVKSVEAIIKSDGNLEVKDTELVLT